MQIINTSSYYYPNKYNQDKKDLICVHDVKFYTNNLNAYPSGNVICDYCNSRIKKNINEEFNFYHCDKCKNFDLCDTCYKHEKKECTDNCIICAKNKCHHIFVCCSDFDFEKIMKDKLSRNICFQKTFSCQKCKKVTFNFFHEKKNYYYCEKCDNFICLECYEFELKNNFEKSKLKIDLDVKIEL
jgi:hypothetical protein